MDIFLRVTVKNLIETFIAGYLNSIVMFRQSVHDTDQSGALGQISDAVSGLIFPPRDGEVGVPFTARICWRYVKESALRAHVFISARLGVNSFTRLCNKEKRDG